MRAEFDWRYIRRYTALPLVTLLVSITLFAVSTWLRADQEAQYARFSANYDATQEDYDALVYRRRLVDRYHRRYQQFHELGFVGEESRLDWIETLRAATEELTLPRVSYAIEPQLNVVAPVQSIAAEGNSQIHVSRMQLEMGLVHEVDLLRFIDEFQRKAPGLVKVDECELGWLSPQEAPSASEANLSARCAVSIFSVITSDIAVAELTP